MMTVDINFNIDSATIKEVSSGNYKILLSGWAFTSEGETPEIAISLMCDNKNEINIECFYRSDVCAAYQIEGPLKCGFIVSFISPKNLKRLAIILRDINKRNQVEYIVSLKADTTLKADTIFSKLFTILKKSYITLQKEGVGRFAHKIFNKIRNYRYLKSVKNNDYGLTAVCDSGLDLSEAIARSGCINNVYIPRLEAPPMESKPARLICFYLPQYHEIPENNAWWGEGFTEWTYVRAAQPQFEGHYQPDLPGDLGYYNLLDPDVQKEQVELAKLYGIEGFCFYFYWFGGKRLLEKPVENYLNNNNLDLPFCLCWANENWTRRWDGLEDEVLMHQKHSAEDDLAFISYISKYFKDSRYIRVNNKPLLIVYRPSLLPNARKTAERWRKWCLDNHIGEIHLAYTQSFEVVPPEHYGFDAAIEFPPNITSPREVTKYVKPLAEEFSCKVYDWRTFLERSCNYKDPAYKLYRGLCPSWDNTPRRKNRSNIFVLNSPEGYREWLVNAIDDTVKRFNSYDERLVFINAWNEWAEGAYLEPNKTCGYAYLDMTRQALEFFCSENEAVSYTKFHHEELYKIRKEELLYYFKSKWHIKYDFLLDYYGFLMFLHKESLASYSVSNGLPYCHLNGGKSFRLEARKDLHDLYLNVLALSTDEIITFVILQHNQVEHTLECVRAIKRLNDYRVRIVIVDNGSTDDNRKVTEDAFNNEPEITIIFNEQNKGFAEGNNIGYRYARITLKSKFIIILNNDTVIEDRDFILCMEKIFANWSFSALGPEIITPYGRNENPWNDYIYNIDGWRELLDLYIKQQDEFIKTGTAEFKKPGLITTHKNNIINPILQGAAIILSPLYILNNDYVFEEITFLYGEEHPFAVNALIKGGLLLYSSELRILHNEGVTTGKLKERQKMLMGYEGAIKSIEKSIDLLQAYLDSIKVEQPVFVNRENIFRHNNNKKKILFDLFFCQPGYHGGGEYSKAVFTELLNKVLLNDDLDLWVVANPDLYLDQWIWDRCKKNRVKIIPVKCYDEIKEIINLDFFDLFFAPAIVVYTDGYEYMKHAGTALNLSASKTKVIGVIHDIRDYELASNYDKVLNHRRIIKCLPEMKMNEICINTAIDEKKVEACALKDMYQTICSSSQVDTIVTVSNYTEERVKTEILNCPDKLRVYYSPMKHKPEPERFSFDNFDFKIMNYMLFVNASRLEKNAASFIRAFDNLLSENQKLLKEIYVVLTGIESFGDIGIKPETIKHNQRFILLPFLKPEHLEYLYQNADCLVYTTFYEGFGYPPLEAMSYGKPCLVSNVTSIPEICSDAVIYCDPYNLSSIEKAIKTVFSDGLLPEAIRSRYEQVCARQREDLDKLVNLLVDKVRNI